MTTATAPTSSTAPGSMVTRRGHIQYGSLLIGYGTPYRLYSLTGWAELPALDSGTVVRADAHGAAPGRLLARTRLVEATLTIRTRGDQVGAVVGALEAATGVVDDEQPLVIWKDERGPLMTWARVLRRAVPVDKTYTVGTIAGVTIQWEATDPRRYGLDEQTATGALPVPEPGITWPLEWPLDFGEPGSTGALSATNTGTAPAHPIVEFRGPVDRPALINVTTGDTLEYDLPLTAGDVLTVDTRAGTVVLNGTASRLYTATARSVPEQTFTIPPGVTDYAFRAAPGSSDPAASVTVRYRAAYW